MFQLTVEEVENISMRWQIDTASKRNVRYRPYVFTEHGAVMLASVLRSQTAIDASIQVVRAFVRIRTILLEHKDLADKIEKLERKVDDKFDTQDEQIAVLFEAIKRLIAPPKSDAKSIGFINNEKKPKKSK